MSKKPTDMKTYSEINDKLSEQQKESLMISLLNTIIDNQNIIISELSGGVGVTTLQLSGISGTLSDEDFGKASGDNCIIIGGTEYFHKQYSAATVIRYGATPRIGAGKVIFDYIDIDRATKTFELKHEEYSAV